jgi:hypothetical protein
MLCEAISSQTAVEQLFEKSLTGFSIVYVWWRKTAKRDFFTPLPTRGTPQWSLSRFS